MTLACESHDTVSASDPPPDRSDRSRRFRRGAPPQYPAAHLRRAKRRSVFLALGTPDHLATYGSGLRLRPGVRDERRRDGSAPRLEREGPHDCGYFFADDRRIFYATTEHAGAACPPRPDYSKGYVWALFNYDIYV